MWHYKRQYRTKITNIEKDLWMRAAQIIFFSYFYILKLISFKHSVDFCYFISETYTFYLKLHLQYIYYTINASSLWVLLIVWHVCYNINDSYRQSTNIKTIYVYASDSEWASLSKIFAFLHSGNCYFFQYFVGTSDTLSVQMQYMLVGFTCTDKISKCTDNTPKKHYWAIAPPAPPPLWHASG